MIAHGRAATLVARLLFAPTCKGPREFESRRHTLHTGLGMRLYLRSVRYGAWGGAKFALGALQNRGLGRVFRVVHSGASAAVVFCAWCTRYRAAVHQAIIPAQRNHTQRTARRFPSGSPQRTAPAARFRRVPNPRVHQAKNSAPRHAREAYSQKKPRPRVRMAEGTCAYRVPLTSRRPSRCRRRTRGPPLNPGAWAAGCR